ncbi:MAG: hypothetical protein ACOZNI_34865 [Myxococcota bacterium]
MYPPLGPELKISVELKSLRSAFVPVLRVSTASAPSGPAAESGWYSSEGASWEQWPHLADEGEFTRFGTEEHR